MYSRSILPALVLATFANAQTFASSSVNVVSTASQAMPPIATQSLNPALVTSAERAQWCLAQLQTCPQICGGYAAINQCSQELLTYSCTCGNGTVPDVTAFEQTLPFYLCLETHIQCIEAHPNDLVGQTECNENRDCGTRNATAEAAAVSSESSSTTSASATSSATASASDSATSAAASATESATDSNVAPATTMATGAFAAVLMAAFGLLL